MKTINGKPLIDGVNDLDTLGMEKMCEAHDLTLKYDLSGLKLDQIAKVLTAVRIEDRKQVRAGLLKAIDAVDSDHAAIYELPGLFIAKNKGAAE